jgi:N-acetylmuramoyl-L-alanine amidase
MSYSYKYNRIFNPSLTKYLFFVILLFSITEFYSQEKFKIVIDAGHGGKDPGKPTKLGFTEKEIALKIALNLGKLLEKDISNEVIYTRKKDIYLGLRQRAKIANSADADLFISIHCNSFHDSSVSGSETFVLGLHANERNFNIAKQENEVIFLEEDFEDNYEGYDPNSSESLIGLTLMQEDYLDQSILLATNIQNNFKNNLNLKNRGVKQSGFWVLHNTYMPSVLVETGFISNPKEAAYLNSSKAQRDIANNINTAVIEYKKALNIGGLISGLEYANSNITYQVQIAASKTKIELNSYNFKGLRNISRLKSAKLYKYYYSSSNSLEETKRKQNFAISRGFKNAFIVGFENGIQISID